ncbi:RluA family pseudouridine synthase [Bacillus mangrovi]|uniref:Pseudouridine synthase n=1 Tax=Metabacillus mangrovi TaxID=1491830 RepID=A0A7X2S570_9BACI|nr:RluA family pseudouridine synthase [Metabacillus mangrovi]
MIETERGEWTVKRKGTWLEFQAENKNPMHVNEWLRESVKASQGVISQYRKQHGLMVNHASIGSANPIVAAGDTVALEVFRQEKDGTIPEYKELSILYEDDHLIAINKPAGMKTHPNEPGETGTLANALAFHYMMQGEDTPVRIVHRLDEDTTGAILFAKHALSQAIMDRDLQDHSIFRTYSAVVNGVPDPPAGTIAEPIGRDRHHPSRRRVSPGGQAAVTHYETVKVLNSSALLKIRLETGRTHQIRVHLSHIGHSIIGDPLYGRPSSKISRQALHASAISFRHPITGEDLLLTAPFPEDMKEWE